LVEDVVRGFGEARIRVFGTSMMPALNPGDVISIQRATIEEVSPGNIVLFSRGGRLFAHRVVEKLGGPDDLRLITRGDRLRRNDPPVSQSELLGRVIRAQRNGKQFDPDKPLNLLEQAIAPLLRASERATYVYMRFFDFQRAIFSGGAVRGI
jgi:hypothetical protein